MGCQRTSRAPCQVREEDTASACYQSMKTKGSVGRAARAGGAGGGRRGAEWAPREPLGSGTGWVGGWPRAPAEVRGLRRGADDVLGGVSGGHGARDERGDEAHDPAHGEVRRGLRIRDPEARAGQT